MMPPAMSSVDECPVVLAAGGAAGQALARPGGLVWRRALVPAVVSAVGGGQRGGRGRGTVSRQCRSVAVPLPTAGPFAHDARSPHAGAPAGGYGAAGLGGCDIRRIRRRLRRRLARPAAAACGDAPSLDACLVLSLTVRPPHPASALADRAAGPIRAGP